MADFPSDEKTLSKVDGPHHDVGDSVDVGLDKTRERKLLRKIDLFVIPILGLLYLMAFLDRFVVTKARHPRRDHLTCLQGQHR